MVYQYEGQIELHDIHADSCEAKLDKFSTENVILKRLPAYYIQEHEEVLVDFH